jgi:hypothetical protein
MALNRLASIEARIERYQQILLDAEFKSAGEEGSNLTHHDPEKIERILDRLYRQRDRIKAGGMFSRGRVTGIGAGR